jgi:hypothetical protein
MCDDDPGHGDAVLRQLQLAEENGTLPDDLEDLNSRGRDAVADDGGDA